MITFPIVCISIVLFMWACANVAGFVVSFGMGAHWIQEVYQKVSKKKNNYSTTIDLLTVGAVVVVLWYVSLHSLWYLWGYASVLFSGGYN